MFHCLVHPETQLHVPADAAAREELLGRVRALAELDHPRLVTVAHVEVRGDNTLAARWRAGQSTDLATVLAVRGRLSPAEAAGVLVGVAQALAAMHSADIVHGPLSALDVALDTGGEAQLRPRLDGPHNSTPADDVLAAARLVEGLLGPRSGDSDETTALRAVLAPALAPDPLVRPEAGTLAAWAHDAVAPEPVRLPEPATLAAAALASGARPTADARSTVGPAQDLRRSAARHRRAYRGSAAAGPLRGVRTLGAGRSGGRRAPGGAARRIVGLAVVSAVAGVLAGVVADVDRPEPSTVHAADGTAVPGEVSCPAAGTARAAVTPPDVPSADPVLDRHDPAGAAGALTERRVALLTGAAQLDGAALRALDLPGSPAHETDRSLVERLSARRVTLNGAQVAVHDVAALEATDERAEVTVEYEVSAHEQLVAGGAATAVPASGTRTSTLSLVWTDAGWRVTEVR